MDFQPGFLTAVLEIMKRAEYGDQGKVCVLMADEMKVKEVIQYNRSTDTLMQPVKYVQTIFVRGLRINWQQPIFVGYDTTLTKDIIIEAIKLLKSIGYHVVAFVSDMHPSNRRCLANMGVTLEKPYFKLFDPEEHY